MEFLAHNTRRDATRQAVEPSGRFSSPAYLAGDLTNLLRSYFAIKILPSIM